MNNKTHYNYSPLQYVPKHKITAEICLLAVQSNAGALEYVPDDLKTKMTIELFQLGSPERAERR